MKQEELREGDIFQSTVNPTFYMCILNPKCSDGKVKFCWYEGLDALHDQRPHSDVDLRIDWDASSQKSFNFSFNHRAVEVPDSDTIKQDVWSL